MSEFWKLHQRPSSPLSTGNGSLNLDKEGGAGEVGGGGNADSWGGQEVLDPPLCLLKFYLIHKL